LNLFWQNVWCLGLLYILTVRSGYLEISDSFSTSCTNPVNNSSNVVGGGTILRVLKKINFFLGCYSTFAGKISETVWVALKGIILTCINSFTSGLVRIKCWWGSFYYFKYVYLRQGTETVIAAFFKNLFESFSILSKSSYAFYSISIWFLLETLRNRLFM